MPGLGYGREEALCQRQALSARKSEGLFSTAVRPPVSARSPSWRKLVPRKSRLETKSENEARSTFLARLWCHLILENPANRAENPTSLCGATIGQTGWRMAQFGAIRSRLETIKNREFGPLLRLIGAFLTW